MKQLSMQDFSVFCDRKSSYKETRILSDLEIRCSLQNGNLNVLDELHIKEPLPSLQKNLQLKSNKYIRLFDGKVYKISYLGVPSKVIGKLRTYKRKDGSLYSKNEVLELQSVICEVYVDGEKKSLYFKENEIMECHDYIFECVYKGDQINTRYGVLTVLNRVELSKDKYLLCKKNNKYLIIEMDEIISKVNPSFFSVKMLDIGDRVRHRYLGYFTVSRVWHGKVAVYDEKNNKTFFIKEQDIVDVITRNEM